MIDRRQLLYGSLLIGGGAATGLTRRPIAVPPIAQSALDAAIPRQIGSYREVGAADAVLPPRDELSARVYDRYLARGFIGAGLPPIMLVIAYGSTRDYGLQLHRPESCYPASGWTLTKREPVRIGIARQGGSDAVLLDARRGAKRETILYWTRIGRRFPVSAMESRLDVLAAILARDVPDGVLVRLSTSALAGGTFATLAAFNDLLLASIDAAGRRLLLGAPR